MKGIRTYVFGFRSDSRELGSARVSHAGQGVLAIANSSRFSRLSAGVNEPERLFRRNAETSTRDACATERSALDVVRL
jgi:hypothetical protein